MYIFFWSLFFVFLTNYKDITPLEILHAFAIHLQLRLEPCRRIDELFPRLKNYTISRNRFSLISSYISCSWKTLVKMLRKKWSNEIELGKVIKIIEFHNILKYCAIDETIFGFKGKCPVKRRIPRKPEGHAEGIMVYFIGGEYSVSKLPFVFSLALVVPGYFRSNSKQQNWKNCMINFFSRFRTNTQRSRYSIN